MLQAVVQHSDQSFKKPTKMVAKKPAAEKAAGAVPESVLKKRKRDEEWGAKKAAAQTEAKSKAKDRRKEIFKRAETYVKEYRDQVRSSQAKLPPSASPQQQSMRGSHSRDVLGV